MGARAGGRGRQGVMGTYRTRVGRHRSALGPEQSHTAAGGTMSLEAASLLYRRPDLYDEINKPDTATVAQLIAAYRPRDPKPSYIAPMGRHAGLGARQRSRRL